MSELQRHFVPLFEDQRLTIIKVLINKISIRIVAMSPIVLFHNGSVKSLTRQGTDKSEGLICDAMV